MLRLFLPLVLWLLWVAWGEMSPAAERQVMARGDPLAQAVTGAGAGDILRLGPGRHAGGLEISTPLIIDCASGAEGVLAPVDITLEDPPA